MSGASFGRQRRIGAWIAAGWLVLIAVYAIFAPWMPKTISPDAKLRIAGKLQNRFKLGPGASALFGTDKVGHDVFSQCVYFARNSLVIGFGATFLGMLVGGSLGMIAGYFRGKVDRVVSILIDSLLAIPALVLAIMLVRRLDEIKETVPMIGWMTRKWELILVLSLLAVAPLARIVRARTLALREAEFVTAARSLGATHLRVLVREILPNLVATMVTVAFTSLGILIGAEGALAFLGVGLTESWGYLIEANRRDLRVGWWATIFPALMLFCTVLATNVVGDQLARKFDIREAGV